LGEKWFFDGKRNEIIGAQGSPNVRQPAPKTDAILVCPTALLREPNHRRIRALDM
jgi:hypothetical protein